MFSWIEVKKVSGNIVNKIVCSFAGEVDAVVAVYDLSSFASFHCASRWIDSPHHNILDLYQIKKFPVFLFGNKLDLCYNNEGREVKGEDIEFMKDIQGITKIGSGFVDSTFESGLVELAQSKIQYRKNIY